ncbi:MAG: bifunctional 2-polyprenyl-6-hydroxyphenol methylase/3-demethylubiquinol 3-O-methyltransferase UbiG [Porticoccaceae bacterium]|nr:bifunctional 2-polyprenyl-6-hydroxyphenol methylase/3-demethylubiquinol 3-O-methyltransferase UbiG [Porticoccaceae bacterium]
MSKQQTGENVDAAEVAKFEALATRWWDANSEFKPLHDFNPLRANWIDKHSPVAEKTLLDVGCGGGILSESMAHRGALVNGIDMGATPLEIARLHAIESGLDIDYQLSTAEKLAENRSTSNAPGFDIVTCLEMLEHVPDPGSVINACAHLVKPGGDLYFSTINRNPKSFLFAIVGAEYLLNLLPKGTHSYANLIRPSELTSWIRAAGLQVNHMTGLVYNPLSKKYRLHASDVSVNYMIHATKPDLTESPEPTES